MDESRTDRRIQLGNWCNQSGAGLGERPQASPQANIDAYGWIKPPGESDGSSEFIVNDEGKGFDRMWDPTSWKARRATATTRVVHSRTHRSPGTGSRRSSRNSSRTPCRQCRSSTAVSAAA
jgi:hypothetical protein